MNGILQYRTPPFGINGESSEEVAGERGLLSPLTPRQERVGGVGLGSGVLNLLILRRRVGLEGHDGAGG